MQNSESERRDFVVMFGREVRSERAWRIRGETWRLVDFVTEENNGRDFVADFDAINGEPLA